VVATGRGSGAATHRSRNEGGRKEQETEETGNTSGHLGFTFTMDVMPGTQVHFGGAPWPVQAENKISSAQAQDKWKTRVKKITRAIRKEEATERRHVREDQARRAGASLDVVETLAQSEPEDEDRVQGEPDWVNINRRGEEKKTRLLNGGDCLVRSLDKRREGRTVADSLTNWISAVSRERSAVRAGDKQRALRYEKAASRLEEVMAEPLARRAFLQFTMTAGFCGRCERSEDGIMRAGGEDARYDGRPAMTTELEHVRCASGLSRPSSNLRDEHCTGAAGEGITGQAWQGTHTARLDRERSGGTATSLLRWRERSRCMAVLAMAAMQSRMKRAMLQLVFNWTDEADQLPSSCENSELQMRSGHNREKKKNGKKKAKREMEARSTVRGGIKGRLRRCKTVTGEVKRRLRRCKTEIGQRVKAVPPAAVQQAEVPRLLHER
jgi:hypothetical protein